MKMMLSASNGINAFMFLVFAMRLQYDLLHEDKKGFRLDYVVTTSLCLVFVLVAFFSELTSLMFIGLVFFILVQIKIWAAYYTHSISYRKHFVK